jgi:hypothetical protein
VAVQERPASLSRQPQLEAVRRDLLTAAFALLAFYDIALAVFMAAAPHTFYDKVGPFGVQNDHYIRDTATFSAAIGFGALVAIRQQSWRVPVLAISTVQFALHSVNHLVDIGKAHPRWNGYFDFFALAATTILLARLLPVARAQERSGAPHRSKDGMSRDLLSSSAEDPRRYQTVELEEAPDDNRNGTRPAQSADHRRVDRHRHR